MESAASSSSSTRLGSAHRNSIASIESSPSAHSQAPSVDSSAANGSSNTGRSSVSDRNKRSNNEVNKADDDSVFEEALNMSKKRSDKNSREQMGYRKILFLIDNIREKLESAGVLSGKESKTEVISAAGNYITQMKRQCESSSDLRAFSSDFYGGLFQCAPYAMALATQSGRLIEANANFLQHFNVTLKPISPQESIFNIIHPQELPEFYIKLGHLISNVDNAIFKYIRIRLMSSGNSSDLSSNLIVSLVKSNSSEVYLLLSILNPDDLAILSLL